MSGITTIAMFGVVTAALVIEPLRVAAAIPLGIFAARFQGRGVRLVGACAAAALHTLVFAALNSGYRFPWFAALVAAFLQVVIVIAVTVRLRRRTSAA